VEQSAQSLQAAVLAQPGWRPSNVSMAEVLLGAGGVPCPSERTWDITHACPPAHCTTCTPARRVNTSNSEQAIHRHATVMNSTDAQLQLTSHPQGRQHLHGT
jgi:hypothetical protein